MVAFLFVGCASNTKQIGSIGDVQFYRVRSSNFTGPNFTALVTKQNDEVKIQQTFGGPGIGSATISALGHVGAAAVLGTSFPGNVSDQVTVSDGNSNATGNGGSANSNATGGKANSNATGGSGGNATAHGGNSTSTGKGTPPGLINNPGHDGHSGNPHNP